MCAKVYFTPDITLENLVKIYEALGRKLHGKVAVKISTGEPGGHHFLQPSLIQDLVHRVDGTIVECCTAYGGKRMDPKDHWKTIEDHGFKAIAPCDIMDETGEIELAVKGGFHLKTNLVGDHFYDYDSWMILSHFKGHAMGGFGGALKNMSIGIASTNGKENFVYINVANNLSVDCDCDAHPKAPEMADLGIFASLDPVALDQACYDAVIHAKDEGKKALIERMDSRHGIHTVEAAAQLQLGSREYEIVEL